MFDEFVGHKVVIDLRSPYVCLGTLKHVEAEYLELRNADLHDLRDSETTRENYVAAIRRAGIHGNRKRVKIARFDVIAISAFDDVIDE